jgi:hypothetical protein
MLYKWRVLLVLLALPATALAQNTPQLHWEQYDNLAEIQPDGSVQVQEQQVVVVDRGPLRGMNRTFETGEYGQIANIRVLEDGQPYRRQDGRDPGTYSGTDDGQKATIRVNFRDQNASRHSFTIQYTIRRTLTDNNDRAGFAWNFFWSQTDAPRINSGSVVLRFPATVSSAQLRVDTRGVPVRQSSTSNSVRWELTQPIQGQQLAVAAVFPRALLAQTAQFRSSTGAPVPNRNVPQPAQGVPPAVATGSGIGSFMFCLIALLFVFIAFSMMRASARGRRAQGYPSTPTSYGPGPFDTPYNRRGWRGRRYGGWGGGFGFPPIIIAPPSRPHDYHPTPDNNNTPFDSGSGGGSSSWGDSGGGSSSWGDSGGGSSSWGDSGGGSSSWSDMGGGSSSWGDSGGSSWGGGGDSGGGSGGGSFD